MPVPVPVPGKLGRRPFDPARRHLVLEQYLSPRTPLSRAGLPPVVAADDVDRSSQVPLFPMYLNDKIGNCTVAWLAHLYGAVSVYAGYPEVLFADSKVQAVYSPFIPNGRCCLASDPCLRDAAFC